MRLKVLVVDDEPLLLRATARTVGARHEVVSAQGAQEALALVAGQRFDVVVTDYTMPGMDGVALAAELAVRAPGLAVVLVSAVSLEELQASERFFKSVVRKPWSSAELLAAIEEAAKG